jgi:putative N-acetylmannosamine-6-phosphate epimerase
MDWLEAIGQDATLRHAPADELNSTLEAAEASEALMAAVASGDSSWLAQEFGKRVMHVTQSSQTFPESEEPEREDEVEPLNPAEPQKGAASPKG